jgi:predicted metal-dependent enzyme (double-stranded beta helix superfamily)
MPDIIPIQEGHAMCDLGHDHQHFGFIVDVPEIRALISETERLTREVQDDASRVEQLRPSFAKLLAADGWLPDEYAQPDFKSRMGGGIGQYALYRAEDGSLTLFALVVPSGARTPVHDHLAWGLIGVYRGRQSETIYLRHDDGSSEGTARLTIKRQQVVGTGEFYVLLPPLDDIHYVETLSDTPSISIHLLANDTACVWRHRFEPEAGTVTPFRSGYSNAPCPPEDSPAQGTGS